MKLKTMLLLLGLLSAGAVQAAAPAVNCAPGAPCETTGTFTATVTNFRTSKQGSQRLLTVTMRIVNRTAQPLTLGYVAQSGVALDEHGNRYLVSGPNGVRAIGEISGAVHDAKFTLPPGEGGDARFEFIWEPGRAKVGKQFELDLAIRELQPAGEGQFKLGAEHVLHFPALGGVAPAAAAPVAASAETPAPPARSDPCAGSARCYNAGNFIAEVIQVTPTAMVKGARHHSVSFNIRFRNISDRPLILAYRASSSAGTDNFGNPFTWGRPGTHDTSVKGIGIVTARSADTQFSLAPSQSRNATFGLIRFNAVPPIGGGWNYDVVIEEIEILPGQQVKSVRQNSVSFAGLVPGSFPGAGLASSGDAGSAASKLIELLERKRKKK
jgi:hypothetical protein